MSQSHRHPWASPFTWVAIAGALLGLGYVVSPITVWFLVSLGGLFAWSGRGLSTRERKWVWSLLVAAVVVRLIAIVVLFLQSEPFQTSSFFWDGDGVYLKTRALWIRNMWLDVPIAQRASLLVFDPSGCTTYLYVIAYLQYLLGPAPYAIHLLNVTLYLAAVVALYRLARASYGRVSALSGFALLLFLPTPLIWSVSALKESLYLFVLVMGLTGAVALVRGPCLMTRAVGVIILAASVATIDGVRGGGILILMAGLGAGTAGGLITRRLWVPVLVLLLLPYAGYRILSHETAQARIMSQLKTAAVLHIGHQRSVGHGYKLLDQRFYSENIPPIDTMTETEGLRFVVRALVSFIVVPLPWEVVSASERLFLPQQIVWYLLVMLAVVGVVAGFRRDPVVTCMLAGVTIAGAVGVSINSGNVGTMARHRDTVVPFVVWLSAVGAVATMSTWISWAAATAPAVFHASVPAGGGDGRI